MIVRKAFAIDASPLGPRSVKIIASTATIDRMGEEIVQDGIDLSAFKSNPIMLWSHNMEHPVATAKSVGIEGGNLVAEAEFIPEGISQKADEICAMVKAGIIKTASVGFDPVETEPMNPSKPKGPQRYLKSTLLEISFVAIPANPDAAVTERAIGAKTKVPDPEWTVGAGDDLPIGDDGEWDGPAAAQSMLDAATDEDGDLDPDTAKLGFLVYDAAKPTKRSGYKLPFADLVDGKLKAMPAGIRAAASRLPDTDIPDDIRTKAETLLAAYEKKAGIGNAQESGEAAEKGRAARRTKGYGTMKIKGLYDLGSLIWVLQELGWAAECSRIEEAFEGDDQSKLPEMLADLVRDVGAALIAMTVEEVGEALALLDGASEQEAEDLSGMDAADVTVIQTSKNPGQRKFRAGLYRAKSMAAVTKAGKRLSATTMKCLQGIQDMGEKAMDCHREAIAQHSKCLKGLQDLVDGNELEPDEGETQEDEKSDGGDGTKSGAAFMSKAQRQAEARSLAAATA